MNKPKILVIEDDEGIREEMKEILDLEGMDATTAENGQDGIEKAKKIIPDLILCDVMMPIKDGYQVFVELKQNIHFKNTPFIFLTARTASDNVRQGMILGADDYITKPFSFDLLVSSIVGRLKKEEERRQYAKQELETLQLNITRAIPHELLTPLNGIMGLSGIMTEPNYEIDEAEVKEFASDIYKSGNRLLHTIKKFIIYTEVELLLTNKKTHQVLRNEITKMGSLILLDQGHTIAKKHNRISDLKLKPELFNAKISLSHFETIIANVLDNAFKFSSKGDAVEIDVQRDDTHVHVTISDSGLGIGSNAIESISAFSQFDRAKNEQQGLGLSLITSINLIQFYNGDISCSLNKPKGTSVKVSLLLAD